MKASARAIALTASLTALGCEFVLTTDVRAQCASAVKVRESDEVLVSFDLTSAPVKRISPDYFGFNLEWVGFQADLWNSDTGAAHPDVAKWLRQMGGAVYRYPGGTVSNFFQWRSAVGGNRPAQKAVDWTGPIRMEFGIGEYFSFLQAVDGKAWIVANLYGEFDREQPIDHQASETAAFAAAVGTASAKSRIPVSRWELGNELDRGANRWGPEKYAANASAVASAIRKADPKAQFVAIWPDYDAFPGVSAVDYARRAGEQLDTGIVEFAQHMYFDGPPGGPPVSNRLQHICKLIDASKARGISPMVWVSEFARWPPGRPSDPNWKLGFPLTANLASAISNADFLIGTTQIKEIRGGMIHSLASSKGPWPMFHRHGEHFDPSAVLLSLVLLRQGLVGDVLPTTVASPDDARTNNPLFRAVAVSSPDKKMLWITLVNRSNAKLFVIVRGSPLPELSKMRITRIDGIHDDDDLANNYATGAKVTLAPISAMALGLRHDTNLTLSLLPNSITVLRLEHQ